MTRRPTALVIAMAFVSIVATGTQVNARDQKKQTQIQQDPHSLSPQSYGPDYQERKYPWPTKIKKPQQARHSSVSRDCLHASAKDLLARLEARFGRVEIVSTCRAGARMPSGHVSWHALNRAFDFKVGKGVDKRDVMVWLGHNSPGVTMSYRSMAHIHTDTGTFHKVIYNAASHEAGERAVAIWMERARIAALPPQREKPKPHQETREAAPWSTTAAYVEPNFEIALETPPEPGPILVADRRDIFRRYVESREIVVNPWVNTTCPGGRDLPEGLQALLRDSASYFGRTVYVNSAYRSPAYNRKVGGARYSQHMQCRAVDFRVAGISPGELKRWIVANLPKWGITGLGTYATHTHADNGQRKASKLVQWNGGARKRMRAYAKHRKPSRYAAAG